MLYQYGLPRVDIVLQSTPLMAISALVVYIILTEAMFANINLVLPTNFGMSVSFLLCMLSVMLSGLTWPIEMMPWYIQELVTWIPLTPFLQAVQVFLYHDANWSDLSSFGVMFLKQAILWLCMAFIIMRAKDIKLFAVWCWHRIHPKAVVAVTPDGVPVVIDPDSTNVPDSDSESNSTNAPESELNSENAPDLESDSTNTPEPESDSTSVPEPEPDSATDPSEAPSKEAQR